LLLLLTILLLSGCVGNQTSCYPLEGLTYDLEPKDIYLKGDNAKINFTVSTSYRKDLEYYGLNVTWKRDWNSTLLYSHAYNSPSGGEIMYVVDLKGLTGDIPTMKGAIWVDAWFKRKNCDEYLIRRDYIIWWEV